MTQLLTQNRGRLTTRNGGSSPKRRPPFRNALYLLPAVALVLALVYFSVGYTVVISFLEWNGFGPGAQFVGFDNYIRVFRDEVYWRGMINVGGFMLLVVVEMTLGLLFAIVLHTRIVLGVIYRIALFVPVVLAPAVMAPTLREILSPDGQLNTVLRLVGLDVLAHAWLADPRTAIFALGMIAIWAGTGFTFILYYAALTQIDPQVFEAARVDGASNLRIIWSVIVPLTRGTHIILFVLGTIVTIRLFDIPQIMTGGGPANSTHFPATYIYRMGVVNFDAGYGGAMTVVMVVICMVLAIAQLRVTSRGRSDT